MEGITYKITLISYQLRRSSVSTIAKFIMHFNSNNYT